MAKQGSFIRLKGNLGGLSFYESNGQALVRQKGGVPKERIMRDAAFKRSRENMKEFGGSARAGKAMRMCFSSFTKTVASKNLVGRVTARMKQVCAKGTGVRGKRPLILTDNKQLLVGLEFNEQRPFASVFLAPHTLTANAGKNQLSLVVPVFNTSDAVSAPQGATHFRLIVAAGVVSNYAYNETTAEYEPMSPLLNMKNRTVYSPEIKLGGVTASDMTVLCALDGNPVIDANSAVVACVGIEFLQMVGTVYYPLKSVNALTVKSVF